ncbi:peptide-methionine (S)-S-oxide reductase MsrA [Methylophaga sp.]|uniref:peptide-methionine (S)-S-oxide reductase MsrA n=1 Tax=Methylophaga sp. TaxID=2024840 RepID=UPI003F69D52B
MNIATFAAGCFWGVEARFRQINGVVDTRVGYTGGDTTNPDYKSVCTGQTGHAEAIEITYEPSVISFRQLVEAFWHMHNPTTLNRQGPDIGTQYRSAIFYHDDQQKQEAEMVKKELNQQEQFSGEIVTEITPATTFYPAEDYHQCYLEKRGQGSCH